MCVPRYIDILLLCVFSCCVLLMFIGSILNQYQSLCCDWKISETLFLVICTFLILFVVFIKTWICGFL